MNGKQLFLAHVRTTQPQLYWKAIQRVFGKKNSGMGGLGDDLTDFLLSDSGYTPLDPNSLYTPLDSSSFSSPNVSDLSSIGVSNDVATAVSNANSAVASSSGGGIGDFFTSLSNAISTIAPTIVQTQAQQNLLAINTARAQQGLGPLTQYGVPVTAASLAPTSATVAQMEAALAGGGLGGMSPIVLIGGALLLVLAFARPERGSSHG